MAGGSCVDLPPGGDRWTWEFNLRSVKNIVHQTCGDISAACPEPSTPALHIYTTLQETWFPGLQRFLWFFVFPLLHSSFALDFKSNLFNKKKKSCILCKAIGGKKKHTNIFIRISCNDFNKWGLQLFNATVFVSAFSWYRCISLPSCEK